MKTYKQISIIVQALCLVMTGFFLLCLVSAKHDDPLWEKAYLFYGILGAAQVIDSIINQACRKRGMKMLHDRKWHLRYCVAFPISLLVTYTALPLISILGACAFFLMACANPVVAIIIFRQMWNEVQHIPPESKKFSTHYES